MTKFDEKAQKRVAVIEHYLEKLRNFDRDLDPSVYIPTGELREIIKEQTVILLDLKAKIERKDQTHEQLKKELQELIDEITDITKDFLVF